MADTATALQIMGAGAAEPQPDASNSIVATIKPGPPAPPVDPTQQKLDILQKGAAGQLDYKPPTGESPYGKDTTQGSGDSFMQAGAGLYNQILGAHQGSGPAYKDMEGNLNYKRLGGLSDIGEGPVITGDDKSQIQFDPKKHVYFLDENGQPVAFERNDKMAEAPWTSAGRLLGFGAMAPSNIKVPSSLLGPGGETARTAADRVADFDASGIPPNLPAVTQGFASGLVAKVLGNIPFVGTPIRRGMGATFDAADNSIEAIANRFGQASGPAEGGEALQSGAAAFKGEKPQVTAGPTTQMEDAQNLSIAKSTPTRDIGFQNKASTLFDAIPIASTKNVNLTNTAEALNGITGKFPSNPALGSTLQSPGFQRWYNLIKDNPNLTWQEVKDFRSYVGRNMRQPPDQLGVGPDDMRNLYGALSRDMEGAANEVGADAASAFSRANNYYRGGLDRLNNVLGIIDNADSPEKAFYWMTRAASETGRTADITRLEQAMRSLPAEARNDAASAVIRRLGQPGKGQAGMEGGTELPGGDFSLGKFVSNYADIADRAKDAIFGAKGTSGRDSLDAFARTMGDLKSVESLANTSKTTQHLLTGGGLIEAGHQIGEMMSTGQVPIGAMASSLIGGIAGRGGAAVLMNPRMTRWLVGAPAAIQAEKWPGYLARLKTISDESPELRPIYEQLGGTEKGRSPMMPSYPGGSFLPPLASQR